MRSYLDGMLRSFEFSGRSTRMHYWMFFLVQIGVTVLALFIDYMMGFYVDLESPLAPFTLFAMFVHIAPSVTIQIRRLHDVGKSGAWLLINLVPFGGLALLYWACCPSQSDSNEYDDPAPSTYQPRVSRPATAPRYSTIPRDIRMGSGRAPSMGARREEPSAGRFI